MTRRRASQRITPPPPDAPQTQTQRRYLLRRGLAWIIDAMLVSAALSLLGVTSSIGQTISLMMFHLLLIGQFGTTPGKLALRLKVRNLNGDKPSYLNAAVRSGIYCGSVLPTLILSEIGQDWTWPLWASVVWYGLSAGTFLIAISPVWNRDGRGIHDRFAHTIVGPANGQTQPRIPERLKSNATLRNTIQQIVPD